MREMTQYSQFEGAMLESLFSLSEKDEFCDLEVQCADGSVAVQGLVFAAICPGIIRSEMGSFESQYLVLPDIQCSEFLLFLQSLLAPVSAQADKESISILKQVLTVLGIKMLPDVTVTFQSTLYDGKESDLEEVSIKLDHANMQIEEETGSFMEIIEDSGILSEHSDQHQGPLDNLRGADTGLDNEKKSRYLENLISESSARYSDFDNLCLFFDERTAVMGKKCLLNLGKIDIDTVRDEVLTENFCDQEGRLVCLVCYKIMGPSEFQTYRDHVKEHDTRQLEKVSIIMPDIGRGGPGLKKKMLSDTEIENLYLDKEEDMLNCNRCQKKYVRSEKVLFRKHLHYHAHKEKKHLYKCTECTRVFNDQSNLKRHVQSVHEKQLFRCLHCDFEDRRKQKLEDHLLSVHKDKVWVYDDVSLNKGQEVLSELTEPLPPLNTGQIIEPVNNPYLYKCSACLFKKRRQDDVEHHIKQVHEGQSATVKKIALKAPDPSHTVHKCDLCDEVFGKRTRLNQHMFRVHNVELVTQFSCKHCGINCANKPGLRAHERTHSDRKFSCSACKKSFLLLNLLKDHVDRGVCRLENRTCQVCSKVFLDRTRRDIHLKIHTNEKSFICDICQKSFTQKRSLKEHCLTHDSVRHYECTFCSKKFVQSNHLKYHQISQHPGAFPSETKHQCAFCSKFFPFSHQLKRHERIHGTACGSVVRSALQCSSCSNWFPSPTLLQAHLEGCADHVAPHHIAGEEEEDTVEGVETLQVTIDMDSYST